MRDRTAWLSEFGVSWRKLILEALEISKESWEDIVQHTLTPIELDTLFDDGYGGSEGVPFTLWTKERVYFPCVYDGREWVASVPRNPCGYKTEHIGGQ